MDCIEWISVFQGRYNGALDRGDLALAEEIELLFFAMWNGYGGQCCRRWCDILGIPVEDGSKVLGEEHPYFGLREYWISQNVQAMASAAEQPTD
jgi:hypothetical protein